MEQRLHCLKGAVESEIKGKGTRKTGLRNDRWVLKTVIYLTLCCFIFKLSKKKYIFTFFQFQDLTLDAARIFFFHFSNLQFAALWFQGKNVIFSMSLF